MKWLQPTDICVVTGGNNGLGAEILREFARRGCQTVSLDIKESEIIETDTHTTSVQNSPTVSPKISGSNSVNSKSSGEAVESTLTDANSVEVNSESAKNIPSVEDDVDTKPELNAEHHNTPSTNSVTEPGVVKNDSVTEETSEEDVSPTLTIECDVRNHADLERAQLLIFEKFNRHPTVIVLNAGIRRSLNSIAETSFEDLQDTVDVNLGGVLKGMRTFLPDLIKGERGFVVVIASALGIVVPKGLCAYGASKAGIIGIHEALVQELSDYQDVHALMVCPGQLNTSMFSDIKTPSDYLAPIVPIQKLAAKIVKRVSKAKTSTIYSPPYVRFLPFMHVVPVSVSRLARRLSGIDRVYDHAITERKAQQEANNTQEKSDMLGDEDPGTSTGNANRELIQVAAEPIGSTINESDEIYSDSEFITAHC